MPYIGRDLRTGAFRQLDDISSGFDGSDTTHTMQVNSTNVSVGDVNQILLSLGGVIQKPGTDFTVSGSTLTFTTAPAANTSFFAILLGSDNGGTVTPTDGSVTTGKIVDDAVTGAKLADDIAITTTGNVSFDGGSFVFNESSADKDFRIEGNGDANLLFTDAGNDRVMIGTDSGGNGKLIINTDDENHIRFENGSELGLIYLGDDGDFNIWAHGTENIKFLNSTGSGTERARIDSSGHLLVGSTSVTNGGGYNKVIEVSGTEGCFSALSGSNEGLFAQNGVNTQVINRADGYMQFRTNNTERMRISSSGSLKVATTSDAVAPNSAGAMIRNTGDGSFRVDNGTVLFLNRFNGDGLVVKIHGDGIQEGDISMSFNTVSYNAFTGSHWSRLADNSKPTILRGTIMDSIDEMCDWYQAVADVAESTDEDGNVIPAHKKRESISLPEGKSVGDAVTFTSNGVEYTGVYEKETDVKHTKCKISDTADSKKVYGVFLNWDDADNGLDGDVNDMKVAQVGTFIIRVNKDVTVEAGDLLVSNGDGTAKKQDDDIIRSKTVAKVNSNVKVETYSDGSYTVPCTLHC